MFALFLKLARTDIFLSSCPLTIRLRMISSMVVLAPHGEEAKALPVVRLATHKCLVPVDAAVGLELLATTSAFTHISTALPNFVLVMFWQRLESLVITDADPPSLLCSGTHTDPI